MARRLAIGWTISLMLGEKEMRGERAVRVNFGRNMHNCPPLKYGPGPKERGESGRREEGRKGRRRRWKEYNDGTSLTCG
jgi:hypothetical protein